MPNSVILGQTVQEQLWRSDPHAPPFKVTGTDSDQSATYDFLLVFHSNYGPILYRFRHSVPNSTSITPVLHSANLSVRCGDLGHDSNGCEDIRHS